MQKILKEGEYSNQRKQKSKRIEAIGSAYWLIATAVYLGWSFLSGDWHITWVIWPIAGILFAVVEKICSSTLDKSE